MFKCVNWTVQDRSGIECNTHWYPFYSTIVGSALLLNHILAYIISKLSTVFSRQREVKCIVERCILIREILRERLRLLGTPGCWDHLTQQGGLYCCTGLNGEKKTPPFQDALLMIYFSILEQQMIHTSFQ